jgi:surface protein
MHLTTLDLHSLDTSGVTSTKGLFTGATVLRVANLANWDLRNVTDMGWMFDRIQGNMQKLILDNWQLNPDASDQGMFSYAFPNEVSVNGMQNMSTQILNVYVNAFRKNSTLTTIDLSSTTLSPKIQSLMFAFRNLNNVKSINISGWDISHVTNVNAMFSGDGALETVNLHGLDFRNTKGLGGAMFYGDSKIATIDMSNTKFADIPSGNSDAFGFVNNITTLNLDGAENIPPYVLQEFVVAARNRHAKTVDLSPFTVTSTISKLDGFFQDLPDMETINLTGLNTANVTSMQVLFRRDYKLTKIIGLNALNTSKVTSMKGMFTQDTSLADVNLSGLDISKVTDISELFFGDQNLTSLNLSGLTFQEGIKDDDVFRSALDKLTELNLTNTKTIPASILRAYVAVARNTHAKSIDLSTLSISRQITNLSGLFADLPDVETINVNNLNTGNVTDMSSMFNNDPQLTRIIGIGSFDTHNVTNMSSMFAAYHNNTVHPLEPLVPTYFGKLQELDLSNWNTSKVTDMSFMFAGQQHLTRLGKLSNWDTSKVTVMSHMFEALASLPDDQLTGLNWNTANVYNMNAMFYGMELQKDLSFVNNWQTGKVKDMSYMFANDPVLTSLDLSHWDTGQVGTFNAPQDYSFALMFANDTALTSVGDISHWNTANVHSTRYMFTNTKNLTKLDLSGWNTSKLQIAGGMFKGAGVQQLNLNNWNFSNLHHFNNYGYSAKQGEFRGPEEMFADLANKAVITMNNISLPGTTDAFVVTDFAGTQPIVVLANGHDGRVLPALTALNQQTWTDDNGKTVTGRQNSNILTLVRADNQGTKVGEHGLNFVFVDQADLSNHLNSQIAANQVKSDIGSFSQSWDQQGDTSNGLLKASLRRSPAANDAFLADWVTPEYQLNTAKPATPTAPANPGTGTNAGRPFTPGQAGAGAGLTSQAQKARGTINGGNSQAKVSSALPQTGDQESHAAFFGLLMLPFLALGAVVNRRHEK